MQFILKQLMVRGLCQTRSIAIYSGCLRAICLSLLLLVSLQAHAEILTTVSHTAITTEQSLQFQLSVTSAAGGQSMGVDFSSLEKDFEILGRSSSSNTVASSSGIQQTQVWSLELLPRREGQLRIPSFSINGDKSEPIVITVSPPRVVVPGGDIGNFHVEVEVDNTQPWVQSQVIFTIRVYYAINLLEGSLSTPETGLVVVHSLGDDKQFRDTRGGRQYTVLERKLALFPQRSGTIELPPIQLNAAVPADTNRTQGFFAPRRQVRRQSLPVTLEVQPRPQSYGSAWWLPASAVTLDGRWEGDVQQIHVGDSITRSLTLQADGADNTQLAELPAPEGDEYRIYTDQPELQSQPGGSGLLSRRTEKWAIVARKPGRLTLPEISVPWFNTTTGKREVAVLPEETIEILPLATENSLDRSSSGASGTSAAAQSAANSADSAPTNPTESPSEPSASNGQALGSISTDPLSENAESTALQTPVAPEETPATPLSDPQSTGNYPVSTRLTGGPTGMSAGASHWRTIALAAIVAWLLTLIAAVAMYMRHKARTTNTRTETSADSHTSVSLSEVTRACSTNDPKASARAIVSWANSQFPDRSPHTLVALARQAESTHLRMELEALDAVLYSGQSRQLALGSLPDLLRQLVDSKRRGGGISQAAVLPEL